MKDGEKPKTPVPAGARANTFQGFTAGFLRPKRLLITLFAVSASLFILNHYSGGSVTGLLGGRNDPPFDEFQGMLYYLTKSEALLPAKLDGSEAQKSEVWSDGKEFTADEWKAKLAAMHKQYPVIVFSKTYCPYSKKAKAILAEYPLKKAPKFIEADLRPDGAKFKSLLTRLTGQATFPNVVINGKAIGGADRTTILHESGKLRKLLQKAGAL